MRVLFLIGLFTIGYGNESNVTRGIISNVFRLFPYDTLTSGLEHLLQPWPNGHPIILSPFEILSDLTHTDFRCGRILSKRVSGGRNTNHLEIPWQVQLIEYSENFIPIRQCSGALIGTKWIISTADCASNAHYIKAYIGSPYNSFIRKSNSTSNVKFIREVKPIVHPRYHDSSNKYNIALFHFNESIESNEIVPVCLPSSNEKFIGMKGQMSGWGEYVYKTNGMRFKRNGSQLIDYYRKWYEMYEKRFFLKEKIKRSGPWFLFNKFINFFLIRYVFTKTLSTNLKVVELPILSKSQCAQGSYSEHIKGIRLEETQFCAFSTRLKGLCPNDRGSPMTIKKGVHILIGLGVIPLECNNVWKASTPSVFINVAYFRKWIDSVIRN